MRNWIGMCIYAIECGYHNFGSLIPRLLPPIFDRLQCANMGEGGLGLGDVVMYGTIK